MHTVPDTKPRRAGQTPASAGTRLAAALWITLAFIAVEAVAGFAANSLALLTDAIHNLTDVMTLGLSWFALRVQGRPAGSQNTYGYHRAGIMVALFNSAGLSLMSIAVMSEAYHRFRAPVSVQAGTLVGVGIVAVLVNLGTALLVRRGREHDLNLESAFLHLAGDMFSTVAAVVVGIAIYFTGANWLDPLISVIVSLLILRAAWRLAREAVDILMEATPRDIDMTALVGDMARVDGVLGVHDLHVWSLSRGLRSMSAHIQIGDAGPHYSDEIRTEIGGLLSRRYGISHSTLQLECAGCDSPELYCELENGPSAAPQ